MDSQADGAGAPDRAGDRSDEGDVIALGGPAAAPRRLRLRRVRARQIDVDARLAQPRGAVEAMIGGAPWLLSLTPAGLAVAPAADDAATLSLTVDGAAASAVGPRGLPIALAGPLLAGFDPLDLDDAALAGATLEAATLDGVERLEAALGATIRFDALAAAPVAGRAADPRPLKIGLAARRADAPQADPPRGAVLRLGIDAAERLLALWERAAQPIDAALPPPPLRARLAVRLGSADLPHADVADLAPGDALLPGATVAGGALLVINERLAARAAPRGGGALAATEPASLARAAASKEFLLMTDAADDAAELLAPPGELARQPVRLVFEAGRLEMSYAELGALRVGETLRLGGAAEPVITIYADGAAFATGELVDVDGKLGVEIKTLAARR